MSRRMLVRGFSTVAAGLAGSDQVDRSDAAPEVSRHAAASEPSYCSHTPQQRKQAGQREQDLLGRHCCRQRRSFFELRAAPLPTSMLSAVSR
ncbi:unnamed protein product [Phaeothamnion confervicola]